MKKQYLILLALLGGAYVLMAMKKKKKGYKITVPEPEKITEGEFYKDYPVIDKNAQVESAVDQSMYGYVGRFPDLY